MKRCFASGMCLLELVTQLARSVVQATLSVFLSLTWPLLRCLHGSRGFRASAIEMDHQIQLPRASYPLCQEHPTSGNGGCHYITML